MLHLEEAASLPVEISVDPAAVISPTMFNGIPAAAQQPSAQQFNLRLQRVGEGLSGENQDIQLRMGSGDHIPAFQVPPGHYKLVAANGGGSWYIESATYGVSDAISGEIAIGSGGGGRNANTSGSE